MVVYVWRYVVPLTSCWSRLRELLFFCESGRLSRAEGNAKGRECRLDSSLTPARMSPPRLETWDEDDDEEEDEEEDVGALGTGREFQSASGLFGGAGGSLSRWGSPGVQGKGRLCSRASVTVPAEWGRSGGGGGGRSLSAGGRGRGLSLWWDAAWSVETGREAQFRGATKPPSLRHELQNQSHNHEYKTPLFFNKLQSSSEV